MLIFSLSGFIPISQFAIMLCLILFASLIGDLVILPALLCGPAGTLFEKKTP
jgi:hypothetical protein